jgi:hypothetical protein
MDIGPLTVETHPRQEDVQYLEDRLHEYNDAQTGITDGQLLALFIRALLLDSRVVAFEDVVY